MAKSFQPVLYKSIFEVAYKPELHFYQKMYVLASSIPDYPHWETSGLNVTLRDPKNRCSLFISHNCLHYEQDSNDLLEAKKRLEVALPILQDLIEKEGNITRLLHRNTYLVSTPQEFHDLCHLLSIKLFSQNSQLKKALPGVQNDLLYRVDTTEGENHHVVTLAPVWKQQALQLLNINRSNHIDPDRPEEDYLELVKKYPALAVYISVDTYRNAPDPYSVNHTPYLKLKTIRSSEVLTFWDTVEKSATDIAHNLCAYLFATDLEIE